VIEPVPGFIIWKTDRSGADKGGGGLALLNKEAIPAHQWTPIVPDNLRYIANERQWLFIDNNTERLAFLHVYIAYLQWNEDLFHLITQEALKLRMQGFIVLAVGDFNKRVFYLQPNNQNQPNWL
jgi:hypothetical protein